MDLSRQWHCSLKLALCLMLYLRPTGRRAIHHLMRHR
jgi:hypothetical protein